jgi:carboxyl-terminal processing protease
VSSNSPQLLVSSNSPKSYLNKAVNIMMVNSINKDSIDWVKFRSEVFKRGKDTKNIRETYPAIRFALRQLGGHHNTFWEPGELGKRLSEDQPVPEIKSEWIIGNIGYIQIPGFMGIDSRAQKFARQIQDKIKELDKNNIQFWIVDLTSNNGGTVMSMLCGIGPLLGEGVAGFLVTPENIYSKWAYSNGIAVYDDSKYQMKLADPYRLKNKIKKLAVIIGPKTASAGEALAVSFKGTKNSYFIGQPTSGCSTGTFGRKLSDGAVILFANSKFADRNKHIYGVPIQPDIYVPLMDGKKSADKVTTSKGVDNQNGNSQFPEVRWKNLRVDNSADKTNEMDEAFLRRAKEAAVEWIYKGEKVEF